MYLNFGKDHFETLDSDEARFGYKEQEMNTIFDKYIHVF